MPEIVGRLRTPRLASAPGSPVVGEMYYDTGTNLLYFWNGTAWTSGGGSTFDVFEQTGDPGGAAGVGDIWIDTDQPTPAPWVPVVSATPPTSPTPADGTLWVYPGSGFYWTFMYDSSETTYKWKFVGGPPMFSLVTALETTASGTYAALATAGPSITIPRAGDYLVEIGVACVSDATGAFAYMSYDIGATAASDADGTGGHWVAGANVLLDMGVGRQKTGLAAATALTAKYKTSRTNSFQNRWMRVIPVRVI